MFSTLFVDAEVVLNPFLVMCTVDKIPTTVCVQLERFSLRMLNYRVH